MFLRSLKSVFLTGVLVAAALAPRPACAVDVKQTVWGFDGQVVFQRYNVFSVLVDNSSGNPFEGEVRLKKLVAGKQVDAQIVESVYLAPYSSRWVQFYPYVKSDWETWEVSWGSGPGSSFAPPNPRSGKPAGVLLVDPDAIPESAGSIKRLPDNLFPPHVTATDCLAAVVLDHAPRWDPARQRSFLEWLKRGGRVYLLRTLEGKALEFTGDLQVLNGEAEWQRVGSGAVMRVERTRRQLDVPFVQRVVEEGSRLAGDDSAAAAVPEKTPVGEDEAITPQDYGYQFANYKWDPETTMLTHLKELSNPDHSWVMIFFLGLVYLGTVFPGCYLIGQRYGGDYRITFGFLLGAVGAFSVVFLLVGRRGYNEVTVIHSVAIARQQPDGGTLDVTQWSNAFVVEGGDFELSHPGTSRIYSSCQDNEPVHGEIRNGADAHFLADIPPFSSRPFAHRALVADRPIDVEVEEWGTIQDTAPAATTVREIQRAVVDRPARALTKFKLRKRKSFPAQPADLYAVCGRRMYRLKDTGTHVELDADVGTLGSLIHVDQFSEFSTSFRRQAIQTNRPQWRDPEPADKFVEMFYPLCARCFALDSQKEVESFVLPDDRVRLLVYAPLPESLHVKSPKFGRQKGFVLYSLDVFRQDAR
ncbi:MAG: hypothetical protein HY290_09115 [Planctomycetia bacterium]|nr:hypothetical protein [Planctomycetia bacterium]